MNREDETPVVDENLRLILSKGHDDWLAKELAEARERFQGALVGGGVLIFVMAALLIFIFTSGPDTGPKPASGEKAPGHDIYLAVDVNGDGEIDFPGDLFSESGLLPGADGLVSFADLNTGGGAAFDRAGVRLGDIFVWRVFRGVTPDSVVAYTSETRSLAKRGVRFIRSVGEIPAADNIIALDAGRAGIAGDTLFLMPPKGGAAVRAAAALRARAAGSEADDSGGAGLTAGVIGFFVCFLMLCFAVREIIVNSSRIARIKRNTTEHRAFLRRYKRG
ncbi:MAG: hypothetical protein ACYYKD_03685 [Rhodospirillales bacterium]